MPYLETLEAWSFRLFGKTAPSVLKRVVQFRQYLERARIKIYPETYVSLMFFTATLTIPISIVSIVIALLYGFMPAIFIIPVPLYVMIGFLLVPMSKASDRSANLEREMPFAASYISVMASGGIAPYSSFKRLSEVDLLPGMKNEGQRNNQRR